MKLSLLTSMVLLVSNALFAQYSIDQKSNQGSPGYNGTLSFINATTGYHFAGRKILKTTDAGENWAELVADFNTVDDRGASYMSGQFVDENTGFVVLRKFDMQNSLNDSSFLYKTVDGGLNWSLIHVNPPNSIQYCSPMFSKSFFKDQNTGWVFGWGLLQGTMDGGQTWNDLYFNDTNAYNNRVIRDMDISSSNTAYAVGYGSWIQSITGNSASTQHYYNGGNTASDDYYLQGVAFVNADTGIVASSYGLIERTYNAGVSWESVLTNFIHDNNEVAIGPNQSIWLAAGDHCDNTGCYYSSAILYSSDYGTTWQALVDQDDYYNRFVDIVWPSENYGIACTINGRIYKIQAAPLGLSDDISDFTIFPNPANQKISVNSASNTNILNLVLLSLDGREIKRTKTSQMDVSTLPAGVYLLNIESENNTVTQKVTIN